MSSFVIKKLGKRFADGKRVFYPFRKVSFSLPDSGLVSIRGKSGSGKSTLLNLLAGLLKPDEGKIIFHGKDIARLKAGELEDYRLRSIGFVYQHYNLLPSLTAYENIALPLKMAGLNQAEIDRRIKELAKRFSLGRLLHKLTSLDSGGEKQRIAIVRALANDPDVILADEPTGALDVKNSKLVMEMLKEISKERLVVMVSHNDFLIEAYSDSIFEISNGVLSGRIKEAKTNTRPHWKKKKRRDGWSNLFVRKHFLEDRFLNAFSFLSCLVGFIALLFSAGFYSGSEKGGEDARWKNAEAYTFSLSEKSYQEVDGSPLRLVHSRRPKLEDISTFDLEGVEIENDYSYFLPDLHAFSINGKPMEGAIFRPIGHHDDSLLKIGDFPRGGLLANEEAMEKFDGLKLGDEIRFDLPYSLSRFGVKDEGVLSFAFVLTGVVSEFSFLNSARFYYDYGLSQEAMKGEALPAISEAVGEKMNIDSLISSLDGQDAATSYSYHIFAKDKEAALSLERRLGWLEASSLSLDGPVLNSYEAYSSLMKAFLLSLLLFVGIAFLGVFFIVAMASYSSFSKRRKEAAICLALGARKQTIRNVYVKESVLIGLLSSLAALIAYPFVAQGINLYLANRFSLVGLIDVPYGTFLGYPLLLPLALLFFAWLSSYVSTRLALNVLRRLPLAVVLRDE